MPAPLEYFFDFTSPYSYIGLQAFDALASKYRRGVNYRPMLLGAAFKASGLPGLVDTPLKGDYARRDIERSAHFHDVPFKWPATFPIATVNTARALIWLQSTGSAKSLSFIQRAFQMYFVEGHNINDLAEIDELAQDIGVDAKAMTAATQDPVIKDKLKAQVDEALSRGVFGAPFMFIDGEPFWGHDRLPQVERWIKMGPF